MPLRLSAPLTPARRWVAALAAALLLSLIGLALTPSPVRADDPLDQQAREIAKDLQCPVCENNSVADSPSELATQMRALIREQLEAGKTRQEIMDYFVARYGEAVLRDPPKAGFTLLVWWVPVIALALAAGVLVVTLRSRLLHASPTLEEEPALTDQERARYERLLEQELHDRVEGRP
ncbi:MAG: cytochrome c-type biogenesis protein CcmH [Chloroflexi bacterium]|nr:cytochrome c-type biogenesis protein CcmH [Chloroflexota bacterium]